MLSKKSIPQIILISILTPAAIAGCARSYTPNDLKKMRPLVIDQISKSPEKAVHCIASLMDEKMSGRGKILLYIPATNHIRLGDGRASVISFISGTPEILSVVEIKALGSGSQATFHRSPHAIRKTESIRSISEIFRDCS